MHCINQCFPTQARVNFCRYAKETRFVCMTYFEVTENSVHILFGKILDNDMLFVFE